MGETMGLTCMTDGRGIGIVMLPLKGYDRAVCEGGPSRIDGPRVPHPPMVQGQRKVYAARSRLLSNTRQHFYLEGKERRGTSPLAVPDQNIETEIRGDGHSNPETGDSRAVKAVKGHCIDYMRNCDLGIRCYFTQF